MICNISGCLQQGKVNDLLLQKLSSTIANLPSSMTECVSNSIRRAIAEAMSEFSPHSSGALVHTASSSIPRQTQKVQRVGFPCDKLTKDQTVPFATLNAKLFNFTSKARSVYEVWSTEELSDNQGDIGMVNDLHFTSS